MIGELHARGALEEAFPLETRPLLQGARLTAWELARMGAPFRLVVDGAAASVLARGAVDVVLIGADRIAANGDTANKVGSLSLAIAARHAGVPLLVVAPESTVDLDTPSGDAIPIEERADDEVTTFRGVRTAPAGTRALNPAFDVTPSSLITAIVTDRRSIRVDRGETPRDGSRAADLPSAAAPPPHEATRRPDDDTPLQRRGPARLHRSGSPVPTVLHGESPVRGRPDRTSGDERVSDG